MRKSSTIFATALLLFTSLRSARCETTNGSLAFFIVSQEKIEGGRFIDTTNFPKLGYVAAKPDLQVTNLADVYPAKVANFAIQGDGKGNQKIAPANPPPSLSVKLTTADAKRFTELTQRAVGKQLLIMLGDKPLTAPKVFMPIETPAIGIDVA